MPPNPDAISTPTDFNFEFRIASGSTMIIF
jgi:hypothetical protein